MPKVNGAATNNHEAVEAFYGSQSVQLFRTQHNTRRLKHFIAITITTRQQGQRFYRTHFQFTKVKMPIGRPIGIRNV